MDGGGTDDPLARFGARRRELRRARALSQFARSERAGLDHSYVSDCERGRLSITPRNIHTLAAAPGVEPVALFRSPADTPEDGEGDGAPRTPRRPRPPDPTAAAPPPPSPGRPPKRPGRYGRAVIVGVRPSVPRALLKASIAATWHRRAHHRRPPLPGQPHRAVGQRNAVDLGPAETAWLPASLPGPAAPVSRCRTPRVGDQRHADENWKIIEALIRERRHYSQSTPETQAPGSKRTPAS
jgi:transcriptional regulator with XRE-family HTH domain